MPELSLDLNFTLIAAVKALCNTRPVFLAVGGDRSHLVIKQETAANQVQDKVNLRYNLKAMKVACPAAAGKILASVEVLALNNFVADSEEVAKAWLKPMDSDAGRLKTYLTIPNAVWFKMNKAEEVMNLESAAQEAHNDKTGVRAIAASLNADGGFEMLGKIAAIDLYNHNTDRFSPGANAILNPRGGEGRLRVTQNPGNVLIALEQGRHRPIGLDPYEASSRFRDVSLTIQHIEQGAPPADPSWFGRYLANDAADRRLEYARNIVADLEDALGPRNRKLPLASKRRLDSDAAQRVDRGMNEAIGLLRARLQQLVAQPAAPAGLVSRLQIIS
jgi:hypothetical protein